MGMGTGAWGRALNVPITPGAVKAMGAALCPSGYLRGGLGCPVQHLWAPIGSIVTANVELGHSRERLLWPAGLGGSVGSTPGSPSPARPLPGADGNTPGSGAEDG